MTGRVTLITGASAGIGTELARVFASRGHRVALVARRADRLEALAAEITAAGGKAPIIIPCDLAQPDSGDQIATALAASGVEVEYVVNNAGFGLFGRAVQRDRSVQHLVVGAPEPSVPTLAEQVIEAVAVSEDVAPSCGLRHDPPSQTRCLKSW